MKKLNLIQSTIILKIRNTTIYYRSRRFAALYAKQAHAETVFSMISALLGHRIRCRSNNCRKNEVRVKLALFNLVQKAMRKEFWS